MSAPSSDSAGIRQAIRAVRAAGWDLNCVNDGEDRTFVQTEHDALNLITDLDDAWLHVRRPRSPEEGPFEKGWGFETAWIRFVLGNSPDEVICDYTTNLDPTLSDLMEGWWN